MGIPISAVKKLVIDKYGIKINDEAAAAITKMLDDKASDIAKYAVKHARSNKRGRVTAEDVEAYKLDPGN